MTGEMRTNAAGSELRRLFFYNGGFLRKDLRAILRAGGFAARIGFPKPGDMVAVWGRSPYAARGEAIAAKYGAPIVRVEDAFLRSIHPGRASRETPLGLIIDEDGVHFDASSPSKLENLLAKHPLDDTDLLNRARDGMARLKQLELSKYNNFDPHIPPPKPGYVLVIDQTEGDASVTYGKATPATFREMLATAQIEHPGQRILIKTHPETRAGLRRGYFGPEHCDARTDLMTDQVSPWALLEGAIAVYCVSSQMGLEAIFAGHKPRLFGQPFYAGWGLTQDENPVARRTRKLTRAQLFAAAYILAPTWFDPCRKRACSFEEAVDQLEAEVRAFRADRAGYDAGGMRLWKRKHMQAFFGQHAPVRFITNASACERPLLWWAGQAPPDRPITRVEDGFLRSRGLGAELVPPLSLVADRSGIYYDPTHPSDLETLIAQEPPAGGRRRVDRLIAKIRAAKLSKYNISGAMPDLPEGRRILVPGQVEDDASIRLGAGDISTNLALLQAARAANPDAIIVYKPHPDVEAGLRKGRIAPDTVLQFADIIADHADPVALLENVEEVWTMTSLMGFEALLRGKKVTCAGMPFYAGWGLTHDLMSPPARRSARPDLLQLAYAALIAYPRYFDPISHRPCPPEVSVERLAAGPLPRPGIANRLLSKLQGVFASAAWLWR